jgi:two-component system cell cycle response regulator
MSTKILTIDDSKTIRLIVAKAFKPFDCVILEGANGVEGLAVASREKPDIIILDYTMPVMDGFETLTKLRSDPELKSIPVIMLTAEAGKDTVLKIAKLGVRDYLIKPFKEEVVVERVGRVVPLKAKGENQGKPKRYDDPVSVLVVEDKPAIIEQFKKGLEDTTWTTTGASQMGEAIDICSKQMMDIVFVNLALPNEGAATLFQTLRGNLRTKGVPIIGLSVKTATEEQARAQQIGFNAVVTKPIDFEDVKAKICRTLGLDTSHKYFQQRDGIVVVLTVPTDVTQTASNEITSRLDAQATAAVEEGIDKMVVDLSNVKGAHIGVIKLVLSAIQSCNDLGLKHALVGSPDVIAECQKYEETRHLSFVASYDEALARLGAQKQAA